LSDGVEALIGFLYIELWITETEKFIQTHIYHKLGNIKKTHVRSYKTMIQELVQKEHKTIPEYVDTPHEVDAKWNPITYKSELYVLSEKKAQWIGSNKKKAQEEAAKNYYDTLIIPE
jgi:dsRNA-specific ribonuclease